MEATTKHTPGPWTVESASSPVIVTEQKHPSSRRKGMRQAVATVCDGWGDEEPLNALLIAAAPDLLAALERLHAIASEALALAGHATTPDGCPRKCQPSSYPGGCQGIGPMA